MKEQQHAPIDRRDDGQKGHNMSNENYEVLLRLPQVLQLIPVSRSAWWAGVKSGKYPASVKLSERTTCWRRSEILAVIQNAQ